MKNRFGILFKPTYFRQNKIKTRMNNPGFKFNSWQRPPLPAGLPTSTIGAEGLNCRVRDGTASAFAIHGASGWNPPASPGGSPRHSHQERYELRCQATPNSLAALLYKIASLSASVRSSCRKRSSSSRWFHMG